MENEQEQPQDILENETDTLEQEKVRFNLELKAGEEKIAGLEKTLAEKDRELAALRQSADEAKQASARLSGELSKAVTAYKELVGQANPGPVAEMLKGDTIAGINESLISARALVAKVRQDIGAETARVSVPAGAPMRMAPDLSALTAREKIKFGIEGG
jgi:predicted RNase H-like nuclease (RuvC/YqgF family)